MQYIDFMAWERFKNKWNQKKKVDFYPNLKGTVNEGELETESYLSVASGTQQMYGSS